MFWGVVESTTRRRQWHPTPVPLPRNSHGRRSLVGCSRWESDTTERLRFHLSLSCTGEGNGTPLQCSCLENPRDGGAWWAAVYGVKESWTRLKQFSSSSRVLLFLSSSRKNLALKVGKYRFVSNLCACVRSSWAGTLTVTGSHFLQVQILLPSGSILAFLASLSFLSKHWSILLLSSRTHPSVHHTHTLTHTHSLVILDFVLSVVRTFQPQCQHVGSSQELLF